MSMTLIGYFLGRAIPGIEKHIEWVIAIVIFLSILPLIVKYIQHRRERRKIAADGKVAGSTREP